MKPFLEVLQLTLYGPVPQKRWDLCSVFMSSANAVDDGLKQFLCCFWSQFEFSRLRLPKTDFKTGHPWGLFKVWTEAWFIKLVYLTSPMSYRISWSLQLNRLVVELYSFDNLVCEPKHEEGRICMGPTESYWGLQRCCYSFSHILASFSVTWSMQIKRVICFQIKEVDLT